MSWPRFTRKSRRLSSEHVAGVDLYLASRAGDADGGLDTQRLVVVDVETSGLSPRIDHLLAIGAVAVEGGLTRFDDSFYALLRQVKPSPNANILVHGIDGTTQTSAPAAADSLVAFLAYARKAPLVGFHADFDRVFISKAMRLVLGMAPSNAWLDLADLAPALYPEHAANARTLDDWTELFGIENHARHDALADALATAQLLQVLLARAAELDASRFADLAARAKEHRWLAQSLKSF
jgi:DNA polymerase-3 subunit epsilon